MAIKAAAALLVALTGPVAAQIQWNKVNPPFSLTPRQYGIGYINTTGMTITGGRDASGATVPNTLGYHSASGTLTEIPTLTQPYFGAGIAQVPNGPTYAFGGINPVTRVESQDTWVLQPGSTTWTLLTTFGSFKPVARRFGVLVYLSKCNGTASGPCLVSTGGITGTTRVGAGAAFLWLAENPPRWEAPTAAQSGAPGGFHSGMGGANPDGTIAYFGMGDTATGVSADIWALAPAGFADPSDAEMTNLAVQTGTYANASTSDPNWGVPGPGRAIDGATDTNHAGVAGCALSTCNRCTHSTDGQGNAWWRVVLPAAQVVDFLRIWVRTDCCLGRNAGFRLFYADRLIDWPGVGNLGSSGLIEINHGLSDLVLSNTRIPVNGVRAQVFYMYLDGPSRTLTICEFQVFQKRPYVWRRLSGVTNVALGRPTAQSTTERCCSGGDSSRLVDNVLTNNYNAQPFSCSHTLGWVAGGANVFVRVDLQAEFDISTLAFWPRTDCCTARNTRWELYVGYSADWQANYKCPNVPADVTPAGGSGATTVSCPSRGRFVHIRRIALAGDENILSVCELQVNANRLLDQPTPRAGMAYTLYGGYIVLFGGYDITGARLNDLRMFDTVLGRWAAPLTPLGTPPIARAFTTLITLPNGTLSSSNLPSNAVAQFGGASSTETLNDMNILTFPRCTPLRNMPGGVGINTESCSQGGTVCEITCTSGFTATNVGALRCNIDGQWSGIMPMCRATPPGMPTIQSVTPGVTNATITWTAPASPGYYGSIDTYKVATVMSDLVESFANGGFPNPSAWRMWQTPVQRTSSFGFENGFLALDAQEGSNLWYDERNAPVLLRTFPTGFNVAGSWTFETYVEFDTEVRLVQPGQLAAIGLHDESEYPTSGYPGVVEFYTGLIVFDGPAYSIGAESSANTFNNWYTATGRTAAFLRIERDARGAQPVYRTYYKYRALDQWIRNVVVITENLFRGGAMTPANMRLALVVKNWNGGSRCKARYRYIRLGPLDCADPGVVRFVSGSTLSATVTGLSGNSAYRFAVSAGNAAGFGAWSSPSTPVTVQARTSVTGALIDVARARQGFSSACSVYNNDQTWGALRALDGITNNLYHSQDNPDQCPQGQWWRVDLGQQAAVKEITFFNRVDCCWDRANNFEFYVGSSENFWENSRCPPENIPTTFNSGNIVTRFGCNLKGRYVILRIAPAWGIFLNFAELQVWTPNSCPARVLNSGVNNVGGNCNAGAGYGSLCQQSCQLGFVQVSGSTDSRCDGEAWDSSPLVCAPACPDLTTPSYTDSTFGCQQSYYRDDFNGDALVAQARFLSLEPVQQAIGDKWLVVDGVLQAASRLGCNNELMLLIDSQKINTFRGSFIYTARISSNDVAGLLFKVTDKLNYYRFSLNFATGTHTLERFIAGTSNFLTDGFMALQTDRFYTLVVTVTGSNILVTVDGVTVLRSADRFLGSGGATGFAGLYASTTALFDDVSYVVPCSSGCTGATNLDTCTFQCAPGLIVTGPATRTCSQSGLAANWNPSTTPATTCTLPPPTFQASVLRVAENAPKALVGDPLVAQSSSADYQLQFELLRVFDKNGVLVPTGTTIFVVDSCSGQVKLRGDGLDFEEPTIANVLPGGAGYLLEVRAFIPPFSAAQTIRNITVQVTNVDEPPIVIDTLFTVNENSAAGTVAGRVVYWDPENSTVTFTTLADPSSGQVTVSSTTGVMTLVLTNLSTNGLVLDFEAAAGNYFPLVVQVTQTNNANLYGSGRAIVQVIDRNDAPIIELNQALEFPELSAVVGGLAGVPFVTDQDRGAFLSTLNYTQVWKDGSNNWPAACNISAGLFPTDNGLATGNRMFNIDLTTGRITQAVAANPAWNTRRPYMIGNVLVRAAFRVCVAVNDFYGGIDTEPVDVLIVANVPDQPTLRNVTLTSFNTPGGQSVDFFGSGLNPQGIANPVINMWYTNGAVTYNFTGCRVTLTNTRITCNTSPGIGTGFAIQGTLDIYPITIGFSTLVRYTAPAAATIGGFSGIPTPGGTQVTITGSNFGPPRTPITLTYGSSYQYVCAQILNDADSHTVFRCITAAGAGANMGWRMLIAGITYTYSGPLWSYAAPSISAILPIGATRLDLLDTVGGEDVQLTGNNFGPAGTAIVATYGGAAGTMIRMTSCVQPTGAAAHTTLNCKTGAGVGRNHRITMSAGGVLAVGTFLWINTNPNVTVGVNQSSNGLSYRSPYVTKIYGPGAFNADTGGGQNVFIEGRYFGPVTYPITIIDSVTYGHVGDEFRYAAVNCRVTGEQPLLSVITCATAEGVGRGHQWTLSIAGQSAPIYAANTSYAAPQVLGFSGPGSNGADTEGGEAVVIAGRNFGPNDAYTNALLKVYYTTMLENGPTPLTDVTYDTPNCQISVSHTQLTCLTVEGAGKDLAWKVTVDGILSQQPTTNYHEPIITNVTDVNGNYVTEANVDGGDVVYVIGDFFGPLAYRNYSNLVQSVSYGITGGEYVVPRSKWQLINHQTMAVTLLPGSGRNLVFRVAVADQTTPPNEAYFSYALPLVLGLAPARAHTYSNPRAPTIISVATRNLPLKDTSTRIKLYFGNGAYTLDLPPLIPQGAQAVADATNLDGSLNIGFQLPRDGGGLDLAVQLRLMQAGTNTGGVYSMINPNSLFSYYDPVINNIIVTKAQFLAAGQNATAADGDAVPCPFPAADATWSCDPAANIIRLEIDGEDFTEDPAKMDRQHGVVRNLELLIGNNTFTGEIWTAAAVRIYSWTHTKVVAYVTTAEGILRLSLSSPRADGSTGVQSVYREFKNLNPAISALTGATIDIPTVGGTAADPLIIQAENLAGSTDLEVYIGGARATILKPAGTQAATNIASEIINDPLRTGSLWNIRVVIPPGQGSGNVVQLVRFIGSKKDGSNTGFTVSYAPPAVTSYAVQLTTGAVTTYNTADRRAVVEVPTDGSALLRVRGTNLGNAPVLLFGDADRVRPTECVGTENTHTCYEAQSLPGEGTGAQFPEYPDGYGIVLEAGNQDGQRLGFAYMAPTITSIASSDTTFPTRGGVPMTVTGTNFGFRKTARPLSTIVVEFGFVINSVFVRSGTCEAPDRFSHTVINCTLPEGSGKELQARIQVADRSTVTANPMMSYDPPVITNLETISRADLDNLNLTVWDWTSVRSSLAVAGATARGRTRGGDILIVSGANFGVRDASAHCIFFMWKNRFASYVQTCDGAETFQGEGEVSAGNVLAWGHEQVVIITPSGLGAKDVDFSIRRSVLLPAAAGMFQFRYNDPQIFTLNPTQGDTEGGDIITITGADFGPTPRNTSNPDLALTSDRFDGANAVTLAEAASIPTAFVAIIFSRDNYRVCITAGANLFGTRPTFLQNCDRDVTVVRQTHDALVFQLPSGVGINRNVSVEVYDIGSRYQLTQRSNGASFSYLPPQIQIFSPSVVYMDGTDQPVKVLGRYFGNAEKMDAQRWSDQERYKHGVVGGIDCAGELGRTRENGETVVSCEVQQALMPAGYRNFTLFIAGQVGFASENRGSRSLLLVCASGFYGRVNETCLHCPATNENPLLNGAACDGYRPSISVFEDRFTYPRPLAGWYNLNSSDKYSRTFGESMLPACPEGFQDNGRDVCIVPCDPPESCLGNNFCKEGYTSKPPMWRCAYCDKGFYKRAGECIRCPDSPAALFIGFILLVIAAATIGFMLNKKQVNIAVISIGVDFFQVLAIFSQSRIKWPAVVKELMHVLSAFNLNIEIVAPECLVPDVSYKQKFWFIMILPLCVAFLLLATFLVLAFNKAVIKGREKKRWFSHKPTLMSSTLVLLYMLYLYLTRTIFDVFNCTPTMPPDGYTYLSVVFERCGVKGGTQLTLLPYAVAGLVVYTGGYPGFVGFTLWRNRELVMEDQLLRAKNVGNDRLTNPHAFMFRKTYGRSYFQFKPDHYLWVLAIIIRKFFIAITAVVFNKNSSFQMAACLLVVFLAYALHVQVRPYMSPSEYDEVLRSHNEKALTNAVHARLKAAIMNIETRGRKRAHKNLMDAEGKIDRAAVLGLLGNWLFNYNTVEAVMLFSALIVCLMGIMYQSVEASSYYPESKDSVTSVVLAVIILAILYFFFVFITEIVVLYNQDARTKQLARLAKTKKASGEEDKDRKARKSLSGEENFNVGNVESVMNPMMMNANAGTAAVSASSALDAILAQRDAPPVELWRVFQSTFSDMHRQLTDAQEQLSLAKRNAQLGTAARPAPEEEESEVAAAVKARAKTQFAPQALGGASGTNPLARRSGLALKSAGSRKALKAEAEE